ncbi:MAG: class I SAM-dependent methyltransferase, partial [Clostridia bacterium]
MNYTFDYNVSNQNLQFITHEKLFSPASPDKGTLAMLEKIEIEETDKVLDLGCGYGFVGVVLKSSNPSIKVDMVDKDPMAIEYAYKNIKNNDLDIRAWVSIGFADVKDHDYTKILSNPPYHADFSVAKGFIEEGFKRLLIKGQMILVVKRLLWYK